MPTLDHISCLKNILHGDIPLLSATIEEDDSTITRPKVIRAITVIKIQKRVGFAAPSDVSRVSSRPCSCNTSRRLSFKVCARLEFGVAVLMIELRNF